MSIRATLNSFVEYQQVIHRRVLKWLWPRRWYGLEPIDDTVIALKLDSDGKSPEIFLSSSQDGRHRVWIVEFDHEEGISSGGWRIHEKDWKLAALAAETYANGGK